VSTEVLDREVTVRLDESGIPHAVASIPCIECGCPWEYSLDELGLWWDAGPEISQDCTDPLCDCHLDATRGLRFRANVAS